MLTVVKKWGNSLGVRIPKSIVSDTRIEDGSEIEITSTESVITLKVHRKKTYDLKTLLEGINESNLHGEILTGDSRGNEVW